MHTGHVTQSTSHLLKDSERFAHYQSNLPADQWQHPRPVVIGSGSCYSIEFAVGMGGACPPFSRLFFKGVPGLRPEYSCLILIDTRYTSRE